MKRHRSPSGGAAVPRPAGRARPRGAVIGVTAGLFAAALLTAACSSASSGRQVASLGGHRGGAAVSSRITTAQSDQDMLNYARCMRAHGVNQPDPRHILQPVIQQKTAAMTPARIAALASYARCMRAHDIAMLDPTSSGQLNLGNVPGISSNFGRSSPQFRGADAACRHLLPAGIHDDGTGP